MHDLIMRRILYLSSKNCDLLDDPSSLFFQELLKDAVADSTCANDSEFGICGHELTRTFGVNRLLSSMLCHPLFELSPASIIYLFLNPSDMPFYLRHIVTFTEVTRRHVADYGNKSSQLMNEFD